MRIGAEKKPPFGWCGACSRAVWIARRVTLPATSPVRGGRLTLSSLTSLSLLVILASAGFSCSPSFTPKACTKDDECGAGRVCVPNGAAGSTALQCVAATDAPLRIGMSAPASGPSQSLGTEMKKG